MQEVEIIIDKPRKLVIESVISDKTGQASNYEILSGSWGVG